MKSKTFNLFILSAGILVAAFLLTIFKETLGLGDNAMLIGAIATLAFGIGIAGLIIGLGEIRNSHTPKTWVGLIGNILVVGFFVLVSIYAFN
ncbi:MAG: hypothetical protein HYZ44_10240 [Bacteroidetes bacterium]|nr:hypothetical protein [Bacteroidota bacterium]